MSKLGQSNIRKLLVVGAIAGYDGSCAKVCCQNWLGRLMGRKPRMVVAGALANKMARIVWAIMTREENYKLA